MRARAGEERRKTRGRRETVPLKGAPEGTRATGSRAKKKTRATTTAKARRFPAGARGWETKRATWTNGNETTRDAIVIVFESRRSWRARANRRSPPPPPAPGPRPPATARIGGGGVLSRPRRVGVSVIRRYDMILPHHNTHYVM